MSETKTESTSEMEQSLPGVPPELVRPGLEPLEVSDSLRPLIDKLDLWQNVWDLREKGYTIVKDIAEPELMDELREAVHMLADQSEPPAKGNAASMLLGRHPAADKVITLPKILALSEFSLGKGFRAGQMIGSIKRKGGEGGPLHSDSGWIPAPLPTHNCLLTWCIPCEGMTKEGGATRVVPGSGPLRRHPTLDEIKTSKWIPLEVEKGSAAVWDGSVWHAGGTRTIPGTRTVLHATYQRLYLDPIEDYRFLLEDEEYMANAPEAMRSLLGADLFFGTSTVERGGTDMMKFMKTAVSSKS